MQNRLVRRWGSGAAMLVVGLAASLLSATPASATNIPVGSVQVVVAQYPFDNLPAKSFSANCPAGQRVLGGGAFTVGGVHAVITEMQPISTAAGDSYKVSAAADQFGIAGTWSFQVFAFCAPVQAALGVQIVPKTNQPTTGPTDLALAQCPPGKFVIGAGGKIDNGNGQVDLGLATNSTGLFASAVAAGAKEDADGFAGFYTLTGYAVCATPIVLSDFQQFTTSTANTTGTSLSSGAVCPSGFRLTGLAGSTSAPGTHLQRIAPNQTNAPNLANFGAQSSIPSPGQWNMDIKLFCAR